MSGSSSERAGVRERACGRACKRAYGRAYVWPCERAQCWRAGDRSRVRAIVRASVRACVRSVRSVRVNLNARAGERASELAGVRTGVRASVRERERESERGLAGLDPATSQSGQWFESAEGQAQPQSNANRRRTPTALH